MGIWREGIEGVRGKVKRGRRVEEKKGDEGGKEVGV